MDETILPATSRLVSALSEAQNCTNKIMQTMQQADQEASSPFQQQSGMGFETLCNQEVVMADVIKMEYELMEAMAQTFQQSASQLQDINSVMQSIASSLEGGVSCWAAAVRPSPALSA